MTAKLLVVCCVCLIWASLASAQQRGPRMLVEGGVGYAAFVDESPIPHGVVQGSVRGRLTPRVTVGPEFTYMRGPGADRDWFLTGNATIDLLAPTRAAVVRPYVVAGAGGTHMSTRVGTGAYSSSEGAFTAGVGARIVAARRWYLAPEFRIGWELHWRLTATVGRAF
jgi:hypothetical protein